MIESNERPDRLAELARRHQQESRRQSLRAPKRIGRIVSDLMERNGYTRIQANEQLERCWRVALQGLEGASAARGSRPGRIRRGVLEVWVSNSTIHQELTFCKPALISRLAGLAPELTIRDIRFRVGVTKDEDRTNG